MVIFSVIIVTYNVKNYLNPALRSVETALLEIPHEIYVVDNASTDGSAPMVLEQFPSVKLIELPENIGFARANNIALKQAQGKYISLLNPDTLVQQSTFPILLEAFEKYPEAGMVGCKILNEDGSLQLSCRRSIPTPWVAFTRLSGLSKLFSKSQLFARYHLTYLNPDETAEVEAISGSFMTIRREILDTAGYLDERFFMYGEDLDWCLRIRQAGWKILYYPKTNIIHYKGKSIIPYQWRHIKHFYEAMILFAEKHPQQVTRYIPLWIVKLSVWLSAIINIIWLKITHISYKRDTTCWIFF
jgi:hypothetical protein